MTSNINTEILMNVDAKFLDAALAADPTYCDRLVEHVERDIDQRLENALGEPPATFIDRMLAEMPPPAGITNYEAANVIMDAFDGAMRERGERELAEADLMGRIADLAEAHGCPEDQPLLRFLEERGLIAIQETGGRMRIWFRDTAPKH